MSTRPLKSIIGRVEKISLPGIDIEGIFAKVDTGAHRSAIDCKKVYEEDGVLKFVLFRKGSKHHDGVVHEEEKFKTITIHNSFGESEERYEVKLKAKIGTKVFKTPFTLADRSKKLYPILIGRKTLQNRFLVDVSEGQPDPDDHES